ncbi:hypothetical protein [Candidatus Burkholderia verschuerenii]|uniref:hypothetical protein n=1 Tax=Candidatus Burkholderia verschuerenii TaxID=242163 RepID=UPI000A9AC573|nr:hypothetical protein [Candidatus Burkholderia verschuerenii]
MDPTAVALSLMREAMTLLDTPEVEVVAQHLRLAIKAAEQVASKQQTPTCDP